MVKIIMHGCNGKMGQVISGLIAADPDMELVAGIDARDDGHNPYPVFTDIYKCDVAADAIIDFSAAVAVDKLLDYCVEKKLPCVLCTTGLSEAQLAKVDEAAKKVAILKSANMSLGINLMLKLLKEAAGVLAPAGFDIEIVEKHHNQKLDAPSGTAKQLLAYMDPKHEHEIVYGRAGHPGKRGREIGLHAVRGGTGAGEHSVHFFGQMEEIELRHRADSREIFARGALKAAAFAVRAEPGLYDMEDVLFGGH